MPTKVPLCEESIARFVAEANAISDHAARQAFLGSTAFTAGQAAPADPFSPEYREFQLSLWKLVSGRSEYRPDVTELNDNLTYVDGPETFFPQVTRHDETIRGYMAAVAAICSAVDAPPGAALVEYGVGWGHTTRQLASRGYKVTAVDIEQRFLDLLEPHSPPGAEPILPLCCAFEDAQFAPQSLDGVVFFECFHHCLNFSKLLANLQSSVRPGGRIVFCAETFYDDWFEFPWGVRLDGHSVHAIRQFGWMELGFRKSFIAAQLAKRGFSVAWGSIPDAGEYRQLMTATRRRDGLARRLLGFHSR